MNQVLPLTLVLYFVSAPMTAAVAGCNPGDYRPEQFQVAIDRESGAAFIHSPCGWSLMGVVALATIDADIRMSGAKPVPREVLAAQALLTPWLATHLHKPRHLAARTAPAARPAH